MGPPEEEGGEVDGLEIERLGGLVRVDDEGRRLSAEEVDGIFQGVVRLAR